MTRQMLLGIVCLFVGFIGGLAFFPVVANTSGSAPAHAEGVRWTSEGGFKEVCECEPKVVVPDSVHQPSVKHAELGPTPHAAPQ